MSGARAAELEAELDAELAGLAPVSPDDAELIALVELDRVSLVELDRVLLWAPALVALLSGVELLERAEPPQAASSRAEREASPDRRRVIALPA